jgi:hypothetical protein
MGGRPWRPRLPASSPSIDEAELSQEGDEACRANLGQGLARFGRRLLIDAIMGCILM